MTDLRNAIEQLNTGLIEFIYPNKGYVTEGEVVSLLKELDQYRNTGMDPEDILSKLQKINDNNEWIPYEKQKPNVEGFYWITYKNEVLNEYCTAKEWYSENHHAFMGHNASVIAWKYDIPYNPEIDSELKLYIEVSDGIVQSTYVNKNIPVSVVLCDYDNAKQEKEGDGFEFGATKACNELEEKKENLKRIF